MKLRLFQGPAGSGKTTRLVEDVAAFLKARSLGEHEKVLALTKMHGSRRRMHSRLASSLGARYFACATIDSVAWRVLQRWRTLARKRGYSACAEGDFEEVCRCAGLLLSETAVSRWATSAFPLLVVDEMQDSKDGQLTMIQGLAQSADCLFAADHYQDLDTTGPNTAVEWARSSGEVVSLSRIHRTSSAGLLEAAGALREGSPLPLKARDFIVLGAQNQNVAASFVSKNLTWWSSSRDIAIITPVGGAKSAFVRGLIARVEEKPIGNPPMGPHRIPWEISQEQEYEELLEGLGLPPDPSATVRSEDVELPSSAVCSQPISEWFEKQRRVAGRVAFSVEEIQRQVRTIHQRSRAFRLVQERGVRAMTVHQAKNREFESVIVLWPYEVAGSVARQRRLLYNAVTRAKQRVLVVVQNKDRLDQPPFTIPA